MTDIEKLEAQKALLVKQVALRDQIQRLTHNQDYEAVFLKDLFLTDAARCIRLSTDMGLTAEQREDCVRQAQATGYIQRYLSTNIQMGYNAEAEIADINSALDELRREVD